MSIHMKENSEGQQLMSESDKFGMKGLRYEVTWVRSDLGTK